MTDKSPFRRVSVTDVSQPSVIPAELSVETLAGEVTVETPASVRVELRWTGDEGFGRGLGLWVDEVERGDEFTCEAEVWTDHRADGCLPPGRYAFADSTYVAERDAVAEWAFELTAAE
ncbi:hypothetical protein [Halorussus sp. AFM4]|uniref:hypothetical protein n=1 Tax=Halorussus sp. AFM4 TaxID=3421651 RepID=UPI003EBBB0D2